MRNNSSINHKDKEENDDINYGFPVDLSLLTDRQRKIVERTRRDFLFKFLKDQGLLEEDDSDKGDLLKDKSERFIHNTKTVLKHYQRIQKIELKLIKLYESYTNEIDVYKRVIIYEHIIAIQYYLSAYYAALKYKLSAVYNHVKI